MPLLLRTLNPTLSHARAHAHTHTHTQGIQINPIDVPYRQDEIARIENGELRVTLEGKLLESIRDGATICFIDYYR